MNKILGVILLVAGMAAGYIGFNKVSNHPLEHIKIKTSLLEGCYIAHPTVFLRLDFLKLNKITYNTSFEPAEDYEMWSKIVFLGKVANLNEVLLYYRIHDNQVSEKRFQEQRSKKNEIVMRMLKSLNSDLYFDITNISKVKNSFKVLNKKLLIYKAFNDISDEKNIFDKEMFSKFIEKTIKEEIHNYQALNKLNFTKRLKLFISLRKYLKNNLIKKISKFKSILRFKLFKFYNNVFNLKVINQNLNFKTIPIIIISYNQLKYLKLLVEKLQSNGYSNIVIIDNNSKYPPLLDYLKSIEDKVIIHYLKENFGHMVFWKNKEIFDLYSKGYFVLTDPDVIRRLRKNSNQFRYQPTCNGLEYT